MKPLNPLRVLLLLLATAIPAHAEPALWVARSPTATVYLFGTVHMLKDDLAWRSPRIDRALAASQDLWLETENAFDAAAIAPFIRQYGTDAAHPLSTKLNTVERTRLQTVVDRDGLPPIARLEPLRPWLVALFIEISGLQKIGYDPNHGVEKILTAEMTESGRPTHGLETTEAALKYFTHLRPKAELQMLDEAMDDEKEGASKINAIVAAWAAGNVDLIGKLVDADAAAKEPEAYQALIVDRNIAWAARLRDRLKGTGVSFVAVGAGHLAGPDSLQSQLASLGITVKRE
ncbi:TraB/GumN family protein [Acidisphaera sp. S103]|uniref:TraB/GumN family protein n=1 Tax=Acidisphaera sp. S103 TaxID=1747223 RepID=UPI00131B4B33|nr:TraB/GumN family protein [Acidisphaera sp. S103]